MAHSDAAVRPTAYRRPSRKLQWMTVVVGFLLFVLLLLETALLVLGSEASVLRPTSMTRDESVQLLKLGASAAALLLGGLTVMLSGACMGRYRALVKLAAFLLFLGASFRLALPCVQNTLQFSGIYVDFSILGMPLNGPIGDAIFSLHWYAIVPALVLTLLGLLGLILIAPKRVPVDAKASLVVSGAADPSDPVDPSDPASRSSAVGSSRTDLPRDH